MWRYQQIIFPLAIIGFLTLAASALAATGDYVPLVQIPGIPAGANFLQYLSGIYNFLISIVGILAMVSLVYGGFRYLTSVGNPAAVEDAKDIINSAIIGLVLALSSWLILNEINPDILVLKKPGQIGALPGKYAYGETSFAKCFTNVDDPGYGTQANPCQCVDGTPQYTTKTRTNLTLSVAPSSVSIGGSVTASGKLTDATTDAGIAGKSIGIIISNSAKNGSGLIPSTGGLLSWLGLVTTITTGSDGNFSVPLGPSKCVATEQWQAVFQGDSTYLPGGSSIVSVTTNPPGTSCTQGDYPFKFAATFMSPSICQNLCSDKNFASDKSYHCIKAVIKAVASKNLSHEEWKTNAQRYNTSDNPLIIPDSAWIAYDGIHYSGFQYTPVTACIDGLATATLLNGSCDQPTELGGVGMTALKYADYSGKSLCTNIANPPAIQCKFLFMLQDAKGNSSEDYLWVRILKP